MCDTVDRRSTRLYCILLCFVAFTQARSSAAVRGAQCSLRSHVRLASRVLLREADVCSSPHDCSTDCCELGRTRGARYQIADVHGLQASSEVAYSHDLLRDTSTATQQCALAAPHGPPNEAPQAPTTSPTIFSTP